MKLTPILAILTQVGASAFGSPAIFANTTFGTVLGQVGYPVDGGVAIPQVCSQFLGIPYAKSPVGKNRFENPQPWDEAYPLGVRTAYEYGSACVQESVVPGTSEDCLYLNIWTPAGKKQGNLPIMFWIHGGAFVTGSGSAVPGLPAYFLNVYDGCGLAAGHDVMVVSINYRLGPLGWLATKNADGTVEGNYGLEDQREALRWVKAQAAAFGGDPDQITIFGESAGAISVLLHTISLRSSGLFHRAISESGFALGNSADYGIQMTKNYATRLSCADKSSGEEIKECLREHSAADLILYAGEINNAFTSGITWGAVVDGINFVDLPMNLVQQGRFNDVDLLLGSNTDEGVLFVYPYYPLGIIGKHAYKKIVNQLLNGGDPSSAMNSTVMSEVYQLYPPSELDNRPMAAKIITDYSFSCGSEYVAAHKPGTYLYRFDHRSACLSDLQLVLPGVYHTLELPFVFQTPVASGCVFTPAEVLLSVQISKMWTNFAKTGAPTPASGELGFQWPKYELLTQKNVLLRTETKGGIQVEEHYNNKRCQFWGALKK